jgi:hypothetical protein
MDGNTFLGPPPCSEGVIERFFEQLLRPSAAGDELAKALPYELARRPRRAGNTPATGAIGAAA